MEIILILLFNLKFILSELIYDQPVFSLQSPNFTLGGLFSLTYLNRSINTAGVDHALAMMCTLKEFNNGSGPFKVDGIFNGLIYDAGSTIKQSEYAAMKLLEYSLNTTTEYFKNGPNEKTQIGAIIADLDTEIFFATQPIFSGLPYTFLGVQFLSSGIGTNNSLQSHPIFKARIVPQSVVISASASGTMAEAIVEMLMYFGWTLVTVLYSSDTFGMEGQSFLQPLLQENSILTICTLITKSDSDENDPQLQVMADCLDQNDSSVVIIWSGAKTEIIAGTGICNVLQSKTGKKLIFISPGLDINSTIQKSALIPISSSFIFKGVNSVSLSDSLNSCFNSIQPETQEYFESEFFKSYLQQKFKCSPDDEQCIKETAATTLVNISEVENSIMLILKSINLLQNHCDLLNNLLNLYKLNVCI